MKRKIKVLRIISSLNPKWGGPSKAIIETSISLAKQGFEVHILTEDTRGSATHKIIKSELKKNFSFQENKIKIIYKGSNSLGQYMFNLKQFLWLRKNRNKYDRVTLHGIWQFSNLMARILLKKNYFIFTHGNLSPWYAENLFKKIKKQIYWFLFEKKNFLNSKCILVTSRGEKLTLKKTFINTNGIKKKVIRYGINKPKINKKKILKKFFTKFPMLKNTEFYLSLGRYHEVKGCEIIINSVKKIENTFKSVILFAGPMAGTTYEMKIKNLIQKYKLQKKIILSDMLIGDLKWGAIQASKATVLASHTENFGVSLVESLCFGKPVLTTDKVNISYEIMNSNAGYIAKDEVNSFTKILKKYDRLNKSELKKLSINSTNCFKKNFDLNVDKNSLGDVLKKDLRVG